MSYASESKMVLSQEDILNGQVKNTYDVIKIFEPCRLMRVGWSVKVIVDALIVVTITKRIITGSDASAVAVTTLTLPDTTAVGKLIYKDITPIDLDPGDELKFAMADTGTSSAGICYAVVIPRPEVPANLSDMVASA